MWVRVNPERALVGSCEYCEAGGGGSGYIERWDGAQRWQGRELIAAFAAEPAHAGAFVAKDEHPGAIAGNLVDAGLGSFAGAEDPDGGFAGALQSLGQIGDDGERHMFDATGRHVTDGGIDRSTAVFGQQNAAYAEEACQPEECSKILRVLDLIERQPDAAMGIAGLQELFEGNRGRGLDDGGACAGSFGFTAGTGVSAVVLGADGDGDGFLPGETDQGVPWFGGLRRLESERFHGAGATMDCGENTVGVAKFEHTDVVTAQEKTRMREHPRWALISEWDTGPGQPGISWWRDQLTAACTTLIRRPF